jgi:hypothetical protein
VLFEKLCIFGYLKVPNSVKTAVRGFRRLLYGIIGIQLSLGGSRIMVWDNGALAISAPGFVVFEGLVYCTGNDFVLALFCFCSFLFLI